MWLPLAAGLVVGRWVLPITWSLLSIRSQGDKRDPVQLKFQVVECSWSSSNAAVKCRVAFTAVGRRW
jgi:hypothetical protein